MSYRQNLRHALMSGQAIRMRGQGITLSPSMSIDSSYTNYPTSTITGTIRDRPLVDRAETVSKSKKKSSKKSSKKASNKQFKSLKFNF